MPKEAKRTFRPFERAAFRLRWGLVVFVVALALPLVVLVGWVYSQLETEAFFQQRTSAEELINRIDERALELFRVEEERPFADYRFFTISENPLIVQKGLRYSPLSRIPSDDMFPGLVGYFEINPEGKFSTPLLPEIKDTATPNLGERELSQRESIARELRALLGRNRLLVERSRVAKEQKLDLSIDAEDKVAFSDRAQAAPVAPVSPAPRAAGKSEMAMGAAADEGAERIGGYVIPKSTKNLGDAKLRERNIDFDLFKQQRVVSSPKQKASSPAKRRVQKKGRRKEKIVVPATQDVQSLTEALSSNFVAEEEAEYRESDVAASPKQNQTDSAVNLLAFAGEIDPLQLTVVDKEKFLFFRKAWREKQRFIQGFVVDRDRFLDSVVGDVLRTSTAVASGKVLVAHDGNIIQEIAQEAEYDRSLSFSKRSVAAKKQKEETLLYRATLSDPLASLELFVLTDYLATGSRARLVDALVGVTVLVLLLGVLGIYRLGMGQISLAKERSDFVSAVSHELKTPLTSIRMYGEMLRSGWVKEENKQREYYDFIFFESERLSRLIENVLHFARLGRGKVGLEMKNYQAAELLELIQQKVGSQVENAGFALAVTESDNEGNLVAVDEDSFVRIFINLVDNALKFSKDADKKQVDIGCRLSNKETVFYVRDYGPGVSAEQKKKIFQLFYRAEDELTRATPGTGIGLALVAELAQSMKAKIDLQNREPGVEFQLRFPKA